MMITRGIPTPTRSDQEVLFTSNKFWQRAKFDIAEDFRVPRIVMSVLEDDLLPGDGYTPDAEFKMTELEKVTIAGKEELLLQVRMRKSDLTRGELEIKIPVFAVNEKNQLMTNANGIFNARFANLVGSSDCGDCVMVNGQANIIVKINPALYDMKKTNPETLTLNQLTLWGNNKINANGNPECLTNESDGTPQITSMYLYGCSTIDVNHLAPEGLESVPQSSYPDLENAVQFSPNGKIFVFDDAIKIRQLKGLLVGSIKVFYNFIKALPLIGNFVQFIEYASECVTRLGGDPKRECNVLGTIVSGALLALDVVTLGKSQLLGITPKGATYLASLEPFVLKSVAADRISRQIAQETVKRSSGTVVELLENIVIKLAPKGGTVIAERLETLLGGLSEILLKCGIQCRNAFNQTLKQLVSKVGAVVDDIIFQFRVFWELEGDTIIGYGKDCLTTIMKQLLGKDTVTNLVYTSQSDLENMPETVNSREVKPSLGEVMNKYVNPSFDARQIDELRAPTSYVPSDTRVPITASRSKNLSRSTIGKKIRTIACKAIADEIDDWRKKKPNATFCDALLKREPGLANQYGEWTVCDELNLKASKQIPQAGTTNFEQMMVGYYGQFAIDPVTGLVSSDASGFNVVYPYLVGQRKLRDGKIKKGYWQAYVYCSQGRPQCEGVVPLLRSNENGYWELPKNSLNTLAKKILSKPEPGDVEFEARLAQQSQYEPNYKDKYATYLKNVKIGKLQITRNNLHHLIADNVAKQVPILQQAMFRCDWNVDDGNNIIELATSTDYLLNSVAGQMGQGYMVDGNYPVTLPLPPLDSSSNVKGQIGINFSPITHLGPHTKFDLFVKSLILASSLQLNSECAAIETELNAIQNKIRSLLQKIAVSQEDKAAIATFTGFDQEMTFSGSRIVSIFNLK